LIGLDGAKRVHSANAKGQWAGWRTGAGAARRRQLCARATTRIAYPSPVHEDGSAQQCRWRVAEGATATWPERRGERCGIATCPRARPATSRPPRSGSAVRCHPGTLRHTGETSVPRHRAKTARS